MRSILVSGQVPDHALAAILPSDLRANLASILFNVTADLGAQLLLGEPIYESLSENSVPILDRLKKIHQGGFWAALENLIRSRIRQEGPRSICRVSRCLTDSELLEDSRNPDVRHIISTVAETVKEVKSWVPLDEQIVDGISAACSIVRNPDFSDRVLGSVRSTLGELVDPSRAPTPRSDHLIIPLIRLAMQIRHLDHEDALATPFVLPMEVDGWVDNCTVIAEQDEWSWSLFQPYTPVSKTVSLLSNKVARGEISSAVPSTVKVTSSSGIEVDWTELVTTVTQRLDAGQGIDAEEGALLICVLSLLKRYRSTEALTASKRLSYEGHILHLFDTAARQKYNACKAWCLVAFLSEQPDAKMTRSVRYSEMGRTRVEQTLSSEIPDLAENLVKILTDDLDNTGLLFSVADARGKYDPFVVGCLREVAESANPQRLYSSDETINRWRQLRQHLPDRIAPHRFSRLIQRLSANTKLVARLQKREFQVEDAGLYLEILQTEPRHEEFFIFCRTGVVELYSDLWASEPHEGTDIGRLMTVLQEREGEV